MTTVSPANDVMTAVKLSTFAINWSGRRKYVKEKLKKGLLTSLKPATVRYFSNQAQ